MISAIRAAPLRVLFLAVAVAVVGLMTVTDLPSASPVHAQEQAVTATRDATGESPPARPTDLQASAGPDSVSLTWTASTDQTVTHYAVLRRDRDKADAGVFKVIDGNAGSATSYTDGSVSPGGSYVYRVKAVSPTGVSQWSSYARADIPADPEDLAPSGLSAKAVFDGGDSAGVALSWDAPAADAASVTGYEILRAVGDGDLATLVADTGSADTTYTDDTATEAGESYAYQVIASRGQGKSQPSNTAWAFIPKATVTVQPSEPRFEHAQITGDFDLHADNGDPAGIWGNDATIWISEDPGLPSTSDKLFAYKRSDGTRDSGKDFDGLNAAGNNDPTGIWSDGATMFVVDVNDNKVYAYKMVDDPDTMNVDEFGTRDTSLEFDLHSSNNNAIGIWGNDDTIWISQNAAPASQDKLFAYKRKDDPSTTNVNEYGARDSDKDFDGLNDAGNNDLTGIWSDGTSMFVADFNDDKVYAYALSGGSRHSGREITLDADNGVAGGLWGDPAAGGLGTLWVVDLSDKKLYAYDLYHSATGAPTIDGTPVVGETLTADASGIEDLDGIPDDVEFSYQWIRVDGDSDDDIAGANESAYTLVAADVGKQIKVRIGFTDSPGNDESVSSEATGVVTVAVPITGDFDLHAANSNPAGIWGNDATIWISEDPGLPSTSDKLFAYKRSNGHRDSGKDFDGLSAAGNNDPTGIWSDGATMFVVDANDNKVYAYKMVDDPDTMNVDEFGTRDTSLEFDLHSSNNNAIGIWGNDDTIWISQNAAPASQDKLFAYKRKDDPSTTNVNEYGARDSDKDFDGLNDAGNNDLTGIWSDGTSMFVADFNDDKVYAYALSGGSRHSGREITLDADNGVAGGLWGDPAAGGLGTLWVVDLSDKKLYAYDLPGMNRAPAFSANSTVRGVDENSAAGKDVGVPVTAMDADDDTLTYSLEGTDAGSFDINASTGQIQTKSGVTYDHETKPSYAVTVKAEDGNGGADTIAVSINLVDVDETPAITLVSVVSDPGDDDTYGEDDIIVVQVTFDQAVTVNGAPSIEFEAGGDQPVHLKQASYASGSGTASLRFHYVVQAADEDTNGIWLQADKLELNGGRILGVDDNVAADLNYASPGRQQGHNVDGSLGPAEPDLTITDVGTYSVTVRVSFPDIDADNVYLQYGPLPFRDLRKGNWVDTIRERILDRDELDTRLEDLEGATGYAVRVSLDPTFPGESTRKMEFTTRHGNLREGPDSLDHTHELTPYYENGVRQGFTLDWSRPITDYDGVTGYRIVRYYHGDQQPRPREIGPQPPVTLTEDTGSQDTEYIDRGPLANGTYTYVIWALDQVGPGREYSLGRAMVTDAFDPPEPPVNATAEDFLDRVELDWDAPPGDNPPTGYVVEREVLGERGTGQVNHFETVRDDRQDDGTGYIDYIQREVGTRVDYYVYSVNTHGFRSAPVKLSLTLGPAGRPHQVRGVAVNDALITWRPPAEYRAGQDAAEKVREKEGHTAEEILTATTGSALPDDRWVTKYRIEVNTWRWRKLAPHGPEGDVRIYNGSNTSWTEVAIVEEGSEQFRVGYFNIEDSELLDHEDSILIRVSAYNGRGWGAPSFMWKLEGGAVKTNEEVYLDRGTVELLSPRKPNLATQPIDELFFKLLMASNMPLERFGLETIEIQTRRDGSEWTLLDRQAAEPIHQLPDGEDPEHYVYIDRYAEDCGAVDYRIRVTNTKGEVSGWSNTLTVSCPSS